MAKKKLLFAAVDIGWRIEHYSKYIRNLLTDEITIHSFVKHAVDSKQYKTDYTYHVQYNDINPVLRWMHSIVFFIFSLTQYNTFYFLSGETLLTRKLRRIEFGIYKLLNKKIIMHFVGSDIRDPKHLIWKEQHLIAYLKDGLRKELSAEWQKRLVADSIKFADHLFVSTPDLLKIIPRAEYLPVFIDYDKFYKDLKSTEVPTSDFFKTDKIKILHSPSHSKIKGSKTILEAIDALGKENDNFEFIYTPDLGINTGSNYPVTRYQLFKLYKEADIVIDQMTIGWYGLQSIEALLSNCHTFCYIEEDLIDPFFKDCPIIPTNALNLMNDLLTLLQNYSKSDLESKQQWVKENHTIEKKGKALLAPI